MSEPITLFVGPTLAGTGLDSLELPGIKLVPPARRGDIAALMNSRAEPGIIALADGTFHSYPSVGHQELRDALEGGWTIYGLCSMGAIRVAEMAHMGMRPWGDVAQRFLTEPDFADDEVTLVHDAEAPYFSMSEPLIHMRKFLQVCREQGVLSAEQESQVLHSLQNRWYAERTLDELRKALELVYDGGVLPVVVAQGLDDFQPYRVKQADLVRFVAERPWLTR